MKQDYIAIREVQVGALCASRPVSAFVGLAVGRHRTHGSWAGMLRLLKVGMKIQGKSMVLRAAMVSDFAVVASLSNLMAAVVC